MHHCRGPEQREQHAEQQREVHRLTEVHELDRFVLVSDELAVLTRLARVPGQRRGPGRAGCRPDEQCVERPLGALGRTVGPAGAGRALCAGEPGQRHRGSGAEAAGAEAARKGGPAGHPELLGTRGPGQRVGNSDGDHAARNRPDAAHGRGAQDDLPVAVRQVAVHGRDQRPPADRLDRDGAHMTAVDLEFGDRGPRDLRDLAVLQQAGQQQVPDRPACPEPLVGELRLEGRAVQRGRGDKCVQAGAENGGAAQRGQRQHAAEQRGAHRDRFPAAPPLERVPDPDQGGRRCSGPGHRPDHRQWVQARRRGAAPRPGIAHGRPGRQRYHGHQRARRSDHGDERVDDHRTGRLCGQPGLSDRCQRGQQRCEGHRPGGAEAADDGRAQQAERHELAAAQAQGGQCLPVVGVGDELPGRGLADDRQPGQPGQRGQRPPAGGLRTDPALHRGRVDIQVVGPERVQRPQVGLECGQVGGTALESHVVGLEHQRVRVHRRRVGRGREQVVAATDSRGELVLGHHETHDPEALRGDISDPDLAGAYLHLGLGRRPHCDHRADPHAVVPGQRVGGKHLARPGLIGHPPGEQLDHPGQAGRGNLEDPERAGVDPLGARVAARIEVRRAKCRRHLRYLRDAGERRQLVRAVDDGVVTVPGDELGERRYRPPGGRRRGHHEPAGQGDQGGQYQPGLPVLPHLRPQQHGDSTHGSLPIPVLATVSRADRIGKVGSNKRAVVLTPRRTAAAEAPAARPGYHHRAERYELRGRQRVTSG